MTLIKTKILENEILQYLLCWGSGVIWPIYLLSYWIVVFSILKTQVILSVCITSILVKFILGN